MCFNLFISAVDKRIFRFKFLFEFGLFVIFFTFHSIVIELNTNLSAMGNTKAATCESKTVYHLTCTAHQNIFESFMNFSKVLKVLFAVSFQTSSAEFTSLFFPQCKIKKKFAKYEIVAFAIQNI